MKRIFIISFIVLLFDIVSKRLVINFMYENESIGIIDNFFSLTFAKNTGVAFSLIEGYVSLVVVATLVILFYLFRYIKSSVCNNVELVSYSFIIGGAIGNLIDRVFYGYVIDFLDFNIFGYSFPIFNLADTFIVVGVFMLLIFCNGRSGRSDKFKS